MLCCLPLAVFPTALRSQPQAGTESTTIKDQSAPPAIHEPAQPPGTQPLEGSPRRLHLPAAVSPNEEAWQTLETAYTGNKMSDRANATRVLGLIRNDVKARNLAEKALSDLKPEVRAAAAAALGDMNSTKSIPKLKKALDDSDPSVVL